MSGARGNVGNVVFRQWNGQTIITSLPETTPRSKSQLGQQRRMTYANLYAKAILEDPAIKKDYRSGITKNLPTAFRVAVADYMNNPVVHEIRVGDYTGLPGEVIKIKATDNFRVMRVYVRITDGAGKLIEEGDAIRYVNRPTFWRYHATQTNHHLKGTTISVTAFDRPKNEGVMEVVV